MVQLIRLVLSLRAVLSLLRLQLFLTYFRLAFFQSADLQKLVLQSADYQTLVLQLGVPNSKCCIGFLVLALVAVILLSSQFEN